MLLNLLLQNYFCKEMSAIGLVSKVHVLYISDNEEIIRKIII